MKNESLSESMPKLIMTVTIMVLIGALFGTLGYYSGRENATKNTPADVKYQKDQLDKINEKEAKNNKQKDIDLLEKIADWETYENEELGFEFKYPKDSILAENPKFYKSNALHIYINDISEINMPMGFNTDNLLKDRSALENNDPTVNFGFAIADSYEIIDDPEILGKKFTILRQLEVCNVQFTREALIYKDNYLIRLHWQYDNINEIINNNSDYFTTNSASCGNSKVWKDKNNFYKDLVSSKTGAISQKWFNDFDQIISTFKFTDTDETADWKTYRNKEYGFEIILLESWKGYKVFEESWNGTTLDGNSVKYEGPKIIIRNPKWSEDKIWQDVPILIFTKDEWQLIEANNLGIFAAPVAPSKLGENNKYVFALPPRWIGFTDASGQNEAQKIVATFKVLALNKANNLETYNGSKIKFGSAFSFKYSPKIWDLEEINLIHKNLDKCIFSPGVLWRNRLVNVISSENIDLSDYKARKVKIGIKDNVSSIDYYFDSETSTVFSLSMPENKKDKTICEKDAETMLNTIFF